MTLQEEMIKFRAVNRLTQAEFAAMCGLSTMTINAVESNKQTPTKKTEYKIKFVIERNGNK